MCFLLSEFLKEKIIFEDKKIAKKMLRVIFKKLPDCFDEVRSEFDGMFQDMIDNYEIKEIRYVKNFQK